VKNRTPRLTGLDGLAGGLEMVTPAHRPARPDTPASSVGRVTSRRPGRDRRGNGAVIDQARTRISRDCRSGDGTSAQTGIASRRSFANLTMSSQDHRLPHLVRPLGLRSSSESGLSERGHRWSSARGVADVCLDPLPAILDGPVLPLRAARHEPARSGCARGDLLDLGGPGPRHDLG
jgi:hypothetical protein